MNTSERDLIQKLDECPASPEVRAEIAYRILSETNRRDELVNEIMIQYRLGFGDNALLHDLGNRLDKERANIDPLRDESVFNLAYGMLPFDDTNLDGYLVEYYFAWARSVGVQEDRVSSIILELGVRSN